MAKKVEIFWKGELVGYINDPCFDMFHVYGKWVKSDGPIANAFAAELQRALDSWEEEMAGIDVTLASANGLVGEFTSLEDGIANIKLEYP